MLVLPIINKNRILKVEIKLKTAKKIKEDEKYNDIKESDIIIGNVNYSDSSYNKKEIDAKDVTEFVRNNDYAKRDFFISTKLNSFTNNYDIYQIICPLKKVNEALDRLYGNCILNMKNEIPNNKKARYVNLKQIGFNDSISNTQLFFNFLNLFECKVIKGATIKIDDYEKFLNVLNKASTPEVTALNKYYKIAKDNAEVYSCISKIYNEEYDKSLNWIKSDKDKIKIKDNIA